MKDKAKELVDKMDIDVGSWSMSLEQCKQCALICVDEIINNHEGEPLDRFWRGVKEEINKL